MTENKIEHKTFEQEFEEDLGLIFEIHLKVVVTDTDEFGVHVEQLPDKVVCKRVKGQAWDEPDEINAVNEAMDAIHHAIKAIPGLEDGAIAGRCLNWMSARVTLNPAHPDHARTQRMIVRKQSQGAGQ